MAYDFSKGGTGAVSGAAAGATFGPLGAAIGGTIGALGGFGKKSSGGGGKKGQVSPGYVSTLDPQQQNLYNEYVKSLTGGGGLYADDFGFNPDKIRDLYTQKFAQPAYEDFQENVVPGITGAFRGKNLQNSSYLAGDLSKAGTKVQNNLNALISEMLYKGEQASYDRKADAVRNILNTQTQVRKRPSGGIFDSLTEIIPGAVEFLTNAFSGDKDKGSDGYQPKFSQTAQLERDFRNGSVYLPGY